VAALLCNVIAYGQLTIPDVVKPYDKIVAGCNCIIPQGGEATFEWSFDKNSQYEISKDGFFAYIWAPPGDHETEVLVIIRTYKELLTVVPDPNDPNNRDKWVLRPIKVLDAIDWNRYSKSFKVSGSPGPGPGPGPEPPPPGPDPPPGPGPTDPYAKLVNGWLKNVPANYYTKDKVIAFANNFTSVAARATATNEIQNIEGFLQATKLAHGATINYDPAEADAWRIPLFDPLAKELQAQYKARNLAPNDKVGIAKLWNETAAALKAAAF
jgi:hypothetical protein